MSRGSYLCGLNGTFDLSKDYLYGYRIDDTYVNKYIPKVPPIKDGIVTYDTISNINYIKEFPRGKIGNYFSERQPVSVNLGVSLNGAAPTLPDFSDPVSFKTGFYYRVARGTPIPCRLSLRAANKWARHFAKANDIEKMSDEDVSYENWREIINFPEWRKKEFDEAKALLESGHLYPKKYKLVKGFAKEEDYSGSFKHFRCINARSDYFKVDVGPFFKQIEKKVFSLDCFIKKIPVKDRSRYIMDKVYQEGGMYVCTDYTSYESGFRKEVMDAIEFEIYKYVGEGHPEFREFWHKIQLLKQTNRIQYKSFQADVPATRMSGEMNTSLGNGIFNYFAFNFACFVSGVKCLGVVEGDDGLNWVSQEPNIKIFEQLGFFIKYEKYLNIGEASFCGQIFDEVAMENIRDPVQAMVKMGWSTRKYINSSNTIKLALLRSRAMSSLYENPACPILNVFNLKVLELTEVSAVKEKTQSMLEREKDTYKRDKNDMMFEYLAKCNHNWKEIFIEPHYNTRRLMETKFGISVAKQLAMEEYIREQVVLGDWDVPHMKDFYTAENRVMSDEYRSRIEPTFPTVHMSKTRLQNCAEDFFDNVNKKLNFTGKIHLNKKTFYNFGPSSKPNKAT